MGDGYGRKIIISLTLGLDLNQSHARVGSGAVVLSVTEIAEPSGGATAPDLLDPGVGVVDCSRLSGDADPVLGGALDGDVDFGDLVQFLVLLRVLVRQEEEVRAGALGYGHGAGYWL